MTKSCIKYFSFNSLLLLVLRDLIINDDILGILIRTSKHDSSYWSVPRYRSIINIDTWYSGMHRQVSIYRSYRSYIRLVCCSTIKLVSNSSIMLYLTFLFFFFHRTGDCLFSSFLSQVPPSFSLLFACVLFISSSKALVGFPVLLPIPTLCLGLWSIEPNRYALLVFPALLPISTFGLQEWSI